MAKKTEKTEYNSLEELMKVINTFKDYGIPVPKELLDKKKEFEQAEKEIKSSKTYIYDTLKANAPFKPIDPEKLKCIEETACELMKKEPDADEPCLLLGKIQCGKTDTFENIIGLCFDKGIDIAIVLTKGTKTLTQQTIKRLQKDFKPLTPNNSTKQRAGVEIQDIMDIHRTGMSKQRVDSYKQIIVCKKESTNMKHLINLFTAKCPWLKEKKVLVVDDEADFASRNYRKAHRTPLINSDGEAVAQDSNYSLAIISDQIDEFRHIPTFCRYLQVTATPYSLYLQPQGELNLYDGKTSTQKKVMPFRPRYTGLVPTHKRYIGGEQYFGEPSKNKESMYSHLFHCLTQECVDIMGKKDERYITGGVASAKIYGLTSALASYFMATAIRRIDQCGKTKIYNSSALIHVEVAKRYHEWQRRLVERLLEDLRRYLVDGDRNDLRVGTAIEAAFEDFSQSVAKGRKAGLVEMDMPTKKQVLEEMRTIFAENNIQLHVVNSENDVPNLLDTNTGELRLTDAANIFIGGNILDRGITLKNMLCFVYGRDPRKFQQDTVLQHSRMYGARDLDDMAVTRFHTTEKIYRALDRMNELDQQLRDWFVEGRDKTELGAVFVGYDKDIKPCAKSKYQVSNTLTLKPGQRVLPTGMWTGSKSATAKTMREIDNMITNAPHFKKADKDGIFEIDKTLVQEILKKIETTYVYDKEHDNIDHKNDMKELLCALDYCMPKDGKLYALLRTDREMSRVRENGAYVDAPDDGHNDTAPARNKATDRPVVMLLRQNGKKIRNEEGENIGWNGAPFYWPVLMTQKKIEKVLYAIDQSRGKKTPEVGYGDLLDGIDENDVLNLTFSGDLIQHFGPEGSEYTEDNCPCESRVMTDNTASKYIVIDNGRPVFNPDADVEKDGDFGIFTHNYGLFPFVLRPYKYLLLRQGRTSNVNMMLLELFEPEMWYTEGCFEYNKNGALVSPDDPKTVLFHSRYTELDRAMNETIDKQADACVWRIHYTVKRVLKYREKLDVAEE